LDPFKKRKLGPTNVQLPQMGFGGAPLGDLFSVVPDSDADATLNAAWDNGIRYYDTAPWYGTGQSEHRMGRMLYRKTEPFAFSTKVGRRLRAPADPAAFAARPRLWAGGLPFEVVFDYSYDGIMRSYEDSLQRLGFLHIDMLIIHDLDFMYHRTEPRVAAYLGQLATSGFRALEELKSAKLIGAIGAGVNELGMIPRFVDLFDMDFFMLAMRYTLGDHSALQKEIPLCEKKGIGFVIAAVFSSGLYATGPVPGAKFNYEDPTPAELDRARKIEAVCKRHGVSLASAALQFPLHHPNVASVIPGGFKPEHVKANIASLKAEIPDAVWHELKHEKLIAEEAPTP
jgi:D-threo-aldose 1-dehydrogenase